MLNQTFHLEAVVSILSGNSLTCLPYSRSSRVVLKAFVGHQYIAGIHIQVYLIQDLQSCIIKLDGRRSL